MSKTRWTILSFAAIAVLFACLVAALVAPRRHEGFGKYNTTWRIEQSSGFHLFDRGIKAQFVADIPVFDGAPRLGTAVHEILREGARKYADDFKPDWDEFCDSLRYGSSAIPWSCETRHEVGLVMPEIAALLGD